MTSRIAPQYCITSTTAYYLPATSSLQGFYSSIQTLQTFINMFLCIYFTRIYIYIYIKLWSAHSFEWIHWAVRIVRSIAAQQTTKYKQKQNKNEKKKKNTAVIKIYSLWLFTLFTIKLVKRKTEISKFTQQERFMLLFNALLNHGIEKKY